jgi:hypothetical protein
MRPAILILSALGALLFDESSDTRITGFARVAATALPC